jgi:hypothetical protein
LSLAQPPTPAFQMRHIITVTEYQLDLRGWVTIRLLGLSERATIPPHLLLELPAGERCARRLALLPDSEDPKIRDWAQGEYLKLHKSSSSVSLNATVLLPLYCSDRLPAARDSSGWDRHHTRLRERRVQAGLKRKTTILSKHKKF